VKEAGTEVFKLFSGLLFWVMLLLSPQNAGQCFFDYLNRCKQQFYLVKEACGFFKM